MKSSRPILRYFRRNVDAPKTEISGQKGRDAFSESVKIYEVQRRSTAGIVKMNHFADLGETGRVVFAIGEDCIVHVMDGIAVWAKSEFSKGVFWGQTFPDPRSKEDPVYAGSLCIQLGDRIDRGPRNTTFSAEAPQVFYGDMMDAPIYSNWWSASQFGNMSNQVREILRSKHGFVL
tara:strand:+ start:7761 stop:8288 length:528 start_codon:yes stop_codon:yes gene_type:complete